MTVPRIKKSKAHRPPVEIMSIARKCRSCGRYSDVGPTESCKWCGAAYGKLELGLDLPPKASPDQSTGPVAK